MNTGFEVSGVLQLDPPNPANDDMGALPKRGCGLLVSACAGDGALGGSGVNAGGCVESANLEGVPKLNGDIADSAGLRDNPPNKGVEGDTSLDALWVLLETPPNVGGATGTWDEPKRDVDDVGFGDTPINEGLVSSMAFSFSPAQRGFSESLIGIG